MSDAQMRAVQVDDYGGPEVLVWREIPIPDPGPGEVRVRLAYAGVNFMDVHTRMGKYARSQTYPVKLPLTLGVEGAGWVDAVGDGVTDWRAGDRVAYCLSRGSYADYAIVPAWRLAPVPDGLDLAQAAATIFQGFTAHYLARDVACIGPGTRCLVHAGAGGIGQILIQLAAAAGGHVIATVGTAAKAEVACRRGAEAAVLYNETDFVAPARNFGDGEGVDVVFDSLGAATFERSLQCLRRRGLMVLYGSNAGPVTCVEPMVLAERGSLSFIRPRLADYVPDAQAVRERAATLFQKIMDGSLVVQIEKIYEMRDVQEAHAILESRRNIGKSVLQLAGDAYDTGSLATQSE